MTKAKWNLLVDALTGVAFVVEAISGFVLWLVLPHGGFQGGRNLAYGQEFLFSRNTWLSLHDWFAVVMVLGILVHLVLHWRWITCMVRNLWREAFPPRPQPQECPSA